MLDEAQKKYAVSLARTSIAQSLGVDLPTKVNEKDLDLGCGGAFVTLEINKQLRGCIGSLDFEKPLNENIWNMAQAAAFQDPRFPSLSPGEFPLITIEISILSPPRPLEAIEALTIGRHGLIISTRYQRGLLLPQVASRYHYSREGFLEATCRKAGLPPGAWQEEGTRIEYFEAEVFGES